MSRIVALKSTTGSNYAGVDGMVLSTANIYFTAYDRRIASVFRTAQSATPGQEAELCREPDCRFGDIVFAKVDDVFYGYFFALAGGMTRSDGFRLPRNRVRLPRSLGLRSRTSTSCPARAIC